MAAGAVLGNVQPGRSVKREMARRWWPRLVILLGAAVVRVAYFAGYARRLPFSDHPFGDAQVYWDWARQLAAGVQTAGVFYRAPLYPYLIAPLVKLGVGPWPVYLFQGLLGLATLLLVQRIASRLYGEWAGLAAMTLAALCGPLVFFESKLLSVSLVVFLITLGAYLLLLVGERRRRWVWLAAGMVFGLAATAWAGAIFAFLSVCVWAVAAREAGRKGVWLGMLGCLLAIGPVTIRNATVGQDFVPISFNGGFTLYQGNNERAAGTLAQPPEMLELQAKGRLLTTIAEQEQFEKHCAESLSGRSIRPSEVSAFWAKKALLWAFHHPVDFALLVGNKLVLALSDYESPSDHSFDLELAELWPLRLAFIRFGLLLALAVTGLLLSWDRQAWPLPAILLGITAAMLTFYVTDRYRLSAYPGLAVLAGAGAHKLRRALRFRKLRVWPAAVGCISLVLSTVAFTLPLRRGSELMRAAAYRDLGDIWQHRADSPAKAEAAYRTALAIYRRSSSPGSRQEGQAQAETWVQLARVYALTGRGDSARAAMQKARSLGSGITLPDFGPDFHVPVRAALARADTTTAIALLEDALARDSSNRDAFLTLGGLLGAHGEYDRAFELLSRAAKRFPKDPALLYNLALAALKTGRYRTAMEQAEQVLRLAPEHPWAGKVAERARAELRR